MIGVCCEYTAARRVAYPRRARHLCTYFWSNSWQDDNLLKSLLWQFKANWGGGGEVGGGGRRGRRGGGGRSGSWAQADVVWTCYLNGNDATKQCWHSDYRWSKHSLLTLCAWEHIMTSYLLLRACFCVHPHITSCDIVIPTNIIPGDGCITAEKLMR